MAAPCANAASEEAATAGWQPTATFVQVGAAESASAVVVGTNWDWRWRRHTRWGDLTGYWEVSAGRWSSELPEGGRSNDWVTQLGITPVLRLQPEAWGGGWFVEGGIGANVLLPIYRAKGRRFGDRSQHEVALRVQHFSNAGIKHPNPGENFLQLRYTRRF